MPMMNTKIKSLNDVSIVETTPYEDQIVGKTGYQILQSIVAKQPDQIALTSLNPDNPTEVVQNISFRELLYKVNQSANLFLSKGLKLNESVTHLLPLVPETFFAKIAAETVGIVNPVNPMLDVEHIVGITKAANTKILLIVGKHCNEQFNKTGMQVAENNKNIHTVYILGADKSECDDNRFFSLEESINLHQGDKILTDVTGELDDIAAYFHTGGSTGLPKLAQHTQRMRAVQVLASSYSLGYQPGDVVALGMPMFHTAGSLICGLYAMLSGARVVLLHANGYRDALVIKNFWKIVDKFNISVLMGVPTVFSALLNISLEDANISSLRSVMTGGSPVPQELQKALFLKIGLEVAQGFGMTEVGGMCIIQMQPNSENRGAAGIRMPFIEIKIAKELTQEKITSEAEINEVGTLCFKGPSVMPGYVGGKAQRETFTDDGWLNTGDLARMDENGEVWIVGRSKDMIIRSGHNIDPLIIEDAFLSHPSIEFAAAVGKPDEYAGELPVAFIQLKKGIAVSEEELITFGRNNIVERAAAPNEIFFVSSMPKTGVDKIFKPSLRCEAVKTTFEKRITETPEITVEVKIIVAVDPKVGILARIVMNGKKDEEQASIIKKILGPFAVQQQFEWKST